MFSAGASTSRDARLLRASENCVRQLAHLFDIYAVFPTCARQLARPFGFRQPAMKVGKNRVRTCILNGRTATVEACSAAELCVCARTRAIAESGIKTAESAHLPRVKTGFVMLLIYVVSTVIQLLSVDYLFLNCRIRSFVFFAAHLPRRSTETLQSADQSNTRDFLASVFVRLFGQETTVTDPEFC